MELLLRIILPVYFMLYFFLLFVLKTVIVGKRINKNPLVLPQDDTAYGLVGLYFKITLLALALYTVIFASFPEMHLYFIQLNILNIKWIQFSGLTLLAISFIWIMIAQYHMKDSWRIGIDQNDKTELITVGLFSYSRNPVFFGMIISLFGLFLTTPNVVTLILFIVGYLMIQIQVRLEEEYLLKAHGNTYITYQNQTRRYI